MIMTSLRVFPSLFIGRREVIQAVEAASVDQSQPGSAFLCGACEEVVVTGREPEQMRDVVVKCRCGEYNQL